MNNLFGPDEEKSSSGLAVSERENCLALWRVSGVGAKTYLALLDAFPSVSAVFSASGDSLKKAGIKPKTVSNIKNFDWAEIVPDLEWLKKEDCHLMCWQDDDYPALLREIADPPPLLFIRGERSLLGALQIAIVGTRKPTPMASRTSHAFAKHFAGVGLTVTSGLALGVDKAAHQGVLAGGGKTIAVAATGLDRVYPAAHRELAGEVVQHGAMVSEFPIGTQPKPGYFPRRNRIISGLSLGVLVVEAAVQSGSLVTARHAMEQGREVFAIPGSIHNPLAKGCHQLIRQGAKLVETADDVLEELASLSVFAASDQSAANVAEEQDEPVLAADYRHLLEKIAFDPISIDELITETSFTAEEISSMLLVLELQGLVSSVPGGLFYRCGSD
ncbi:DNA protecting protein DprA [Cycloclasticus sp. 46_83_sub15_T18]|nr:DNA protecting protein DprA [Cycloclasticus sp. 46_83_sub15_T18]